MKRTKGLQGRWLRNMVSIVLVLVLVCTSIFSLALSSAYYSTVEEALRTKARNIAPFVSPYLQTEYDSGSSEELEAGIHLESYKEQYMTLHLIDKDDRIRVSTESFLVGRESKAEDIVWTMQTEETSAYKGSDPLYVGRIMAVSEPVFDEDGELTGVLRVVMHLRYVDEQILYFTVLVLLVGCLLLGVVYGGGRYYVKSILEPISDVTATAKRIAAGGYGVQIKRQHDDEIGELADTINDMSNKISQSEKLQSEFISSVSHELRTPLTAISGWSETLLAAGGSVEAAEAKRGLNIILRESHRLTMMVEELLEFTRMQDGRFKLNVSMNDLRAEFEDTVFMYGSRLQQEGIDLQYLENDDDIPEIPCDTARMRQVFLNILDNAAKHGGEGGRITAQINREGENVVVRIRDFGAGIAEEELPLIKKKFYKGSSKARGSGIGLAVCEEIVTMHGGRLEIANAEGGGALVSISLPIVEV